MLRFGGTLVAATQRQLSNISSSSRFLYRFFKVFFFDKAIHKCSYFPKGLSYVVLGYRALELYHKINRVYTGEAA
jgi:hypothetical protein